MRKIKFILLILISVLIMGCADSNINNKDTKGINKEEVNEKYPQSVEFFEIIKTCDKNETKKEKSNYIKQTQHEINEKYPYDESKTRQDIALIDDVEKMGIIERLCMWVDEGEYFSDEILYEATNQENMIKISYHPNYKGYDDFNDYISVVNITTDDKKLYDELNENELNGLELHDEAMNMISGYNENKEFNVKDFFEMLSALSDNYKELNNYENTYSYSFNKDGEQLNVIYDSELKKIKNMGYLKDNKFLETFTYDKERDFYRVSFSLREVNHDRKQELFYKVIQ